MKGKITASESTSEVMACYLSTVKKEDLSFYNGTQHFTMTSDILPCLHDKKRKLAQMAEMHVYMQFIYSLFTNIS